MKIGTRSGKCIGIPFIPVSYRLAFAIFIILSIAGSRSYGQWRIATPRDTVTVPANQSTFVTSKIRLTAGGVDMWISPSGTFTENDGTSTFGADGAYTDQVDGAALIPQAQNPPTYGGKVHTYGFTFTAIPGFNPVYFTSLENSYQPSHIYTEHYASQGNFFQFRILADKISDYGRATGSLNVKLARWTAGICVESINLNFGNVPIGSSSQLLDSIASYGLDPLQIDSIKVIDAAGLGDFTFLSQRNNRFTLPTEQTNELKVIFSPSIRGLINAELHVYSHNADPLSRMTVIYLVGLGTAPSFGVGPQQINFGKVRIGYPKVGYTQISNANGNTALHVNTNTKYVQYQPAPPPVAFTFAAQSSVPPFGVTAGSIGQIRTVFSPTARVKYQGALQVRADAVPADSVQLFGEGAAPVPVLVPAKNTNLSFGIVYNGNTQTGTVTLTNQGNWTASVILARISGAFKSMFTFTPADTEFNVEPDSSRIFTIAFHPGSGTDSLHVVAYFELVYDDNSIDTVRLTGTEIEPEVHIYPLFYDFGKVKIGANKTATVSYLSTTLSTLAPVPLQEEDVRPGLFYKEVGKIRTVNPVTRVPFVVNFAPKLPGPATAYAYITANDKRDSVQLTGIGAVAKAVFNPNPVNYGIVPSNTPVTQSTSLKDSGDYTLEVDTIVIKGPSAADFSIIWKPLGTTPNKFPFAIEPDSSINIEVGFITNALTGAVHQATLYVYYNDGTSDSIPLQAIEEAQFLQFAQSSVDFGKHRIKTHSQASGVFRNGSNKTLSAGAVTATSASNAFSVLDTLPAVNARSRDSVKVDFFPQTRGLFTGWLHAFGGDIKTDSIQLRGQGAAALPDFSTDTLNFGIVVLGTGKPLSFELLDTGDWFLKAIKIELVGDKHSEFTYKKGAIMSISSDSIPEQKYSTYDVTFTPNTTTVFHYARLVFTFDDSSQGVVYLVGLDESPSIVLDVDTVDFGKVRIGAPAATRTVNLVSTSRNDLIVQNLNLVTAAPAGTLTATPASGPITVPKRSIYYPIGIAFKPQSIGTFTGELIASGKDVRNDSVNIFITGIGAAPVPTLSSTQLDFGTLFPFYSASRSFTVEDSGNWLLSVIKIDIIGANKADFSLRSAPPGFTVMEDSLRSFIVDFVGTTPYQAAQRTAQIVFMLDDSSTFTVDLIEQDIQPIKVDIRMDNARARIGDIVYPFLRLKTDLPDSLHILDLKGVITYDATLFDLDRAAVSTGDMIQKLGNWKLISNASEAAGTFTYELQGTAAPLGKAGSLLRLKFKPHDNDAPGATSPLNHTSFSFPLRTELNPLVTDGVLVVDSACGNTHIESGTATANMIDQNMPNPFGVKSGTNETQIPFDIGFDNTPVTIRILDVSGREVARPVDNALFNQGRYTVRINASSLSSTGAYFYEFRAGDGKPVYKKMMVSK